MNLNYRLISFLLILFIIGGTYAQNRSNSEAVSDWYFEAAFKIADRDRNDVLSLSELSAFKAEFSWFLETDNFNRANRDNDGGINQNELRSYLDLALASRIEEETWELKALQQKHQYFKSAKAKYFKRQPELAEKLLSNLAWGRKNPNIIEKLISDKNWLRENPRVITALHKNLTWLTEHPDIAQKFYNQKETKYQQPEYKRWRSSHIAFLKKNPSAKKEVIRIDEPIAKKKKTKKDKFAEDLPVLKLRTEELDLKPNETDNTEVNKLRNQVLKLQNDLAEMRKEQMMDQQRVTYRIDSLSKANRQYSSQTQKLKEELYVLKDSLNSDLAKVEMKDAESLNNLDELKKQVKYMRIEKQLARIEEDSLLAQTIRQEKHINNLSEKLEKLETQKLELGDATKPDLSTKLLVEKDSLLNQLYLAKKQTQKAENQLNSALAELKNRKPQVNTDSLYTVNRALKRKYQNLYVDYQIALEEKESLTKALSSNQDNIETLSLNQSEKEASANKFLNKLKRENLNYKIQMDSIMSIQNDRDWEIASLKEQIDQLEKNSPNEVSPIKDDSAEKELLQENLKLESQLARIERQRREERTRKSAEKDSLLAQMDNLHSVIINLKNELKLSEFAVGGNKDAQEWLRKADEGYKKQVARYEVRLDELRYDNQKLRNQLEVNVRESEELKKTLETELNESKKIARRFESRNERLKRRKVKTDPSKELDQLIADLEESQLLGKELQESNRSLRSQLERNFLHMKTQLQQQKKLENEMTIYTSDVARLSTLNDSLNLSLKKATEINWQDSLNYYQNILTLAQNQIVLQQNVVRSQRVAHQQSVDSLFTKIEQLEEEKRKLTNIEQINLQRIRQIEIREAQLKRYETVLKEREQIIEQKESVIQDKLLDLSRKEKKYQDLLEREKQLDLREQRLNVKKRRVVFYLDTFFLP